MVMEKDFRPIYELLAPNEASRVGEAKESGLKFAHYTSAETATKIIKNKEVWLRNTRLMNDYSESSFGLACVGQAWQHLKNNKGLEKRLDRIRSGLTQDVEAVFDHLRNSGHQETFVLCVSEHGARDVDEDRYGRLSMWRAYGGNTNVALVLDCAPLLQETTATGAMTIPIRYSDPVSTGQYFEGIFDRFLDGEEFKDLGLQQLAPIIATALHLAVLSTKHPGFSEEKEWRIVYSMGSYLSMPTIMSSSILNLGGVPQKVFRLPLVDHTDKNFVGVTPKDLLQKIIIGPTTSPLPIYNAFVELLEEEGFSNARERVVISDIPLRRDAG